MFWIIQECILNLLLWGFELRVMNFFDALWIYAFMCLGLAEGVANRGISLDFGEDADPFFGLPVYQQHDDSELIYIRVHFIIIISL